jgi:drug/metabolite transporter (DMT)-like permease
MPLKTLALMLAVCSLLVAGQVAFKKALHIATGGASWGSAVAIATAPSFWLAVASILVASAIWGYVLSYESLSRAYPLISMSYVLMAGVAYFMLDEPLTVSKLTGIGLIVAGVIFLHRA